MPRPKKQQITLWKHLDHEVLRLGKKAGDVLIFNVSLWVKERNEALTQLHREAYIDDETGEEVAAGYPTYEEYEEFGERDYDLPYTQTQYNQRGYEAVTRLGHINRKSLHSALNRLKLHRPEYSTFIYDSQIILANVEPHNAVDNILNASYTGDDRGFPEYLNYWKEKLVEIINEHEGSEAELWQKLQDRASEYAWDNLSGRELIETIKSYVNRHISKIKTKTKPKKAKQLDKLKAAYQIVKELNSDERQVFIQKLLDLDTKLLEQGL